MIPPETIRRFLKATETVDPMTDCNKLTSPVLTGETISPDVVFSKKGDIKMEQMFENGFTQIGNNEFPNIAYKRQSGLLLRERGGQ